MKLTDLLQQPVVITIDKAEAPGIARVKITTAFEGRRSGIAFECDDDLLQQSTASEFLNHTSTCLAALLRHLILESGDTDGTLARTGLRNGIVYMDVSPEGKSDEDSSGSSK